MNTLRKLYDIFQFGVEEKPEWFLKAVLEEKAYDFDIVAFVKRCDGTWRIVHPGYYIFNRQDFDDMVVLDRASGERLIDEYTYGEVEDCE